MNDQLDDKMPLMSHLEELKRILTRVLIVVAAGFIVCYLFKERLFNILALPLANTLPEGSSMVYTGLPEAFFTYLKVSLVASIFITSPFSLYQIWAFIKPGLYPNEKRYAIPFVLVSSLFFIGGSLFAYFVVFPFGFQFFVAFGTDLVKPMISVKEYFSFSLKLLLAFGVIFELPVFMYFLSKVNLVNSKSLIRKRKYAILLIFVIAAFFTPPDVVTQVMMALPLMVLYEISIWVVKIGEKKKDAPEEKGNGNIETDE